MSRRVNFKRDSAVKKCSQRWDTNLYDLYSFLLIVIHIPPFLDFGHFDGSTQLDPFKWSVYPMEPPCSGQTSVKCLVEKIKYFKVKCLVGPHDHLWGSLESSSLKVSTSLGPGLNKERGLENKKKKKMFSKPSTSVVLAALALVSCGKEHYLSFPLIRGCIAQR